MENSTKTWQCIGFGLHIQVNKQVSEILIVEELIQENVRLIIAIANLSCL